MMDIDKEDMNRAWLNRHKSDKFYLYLYDIAWFQIQKTNTRHDKKEDYVQFAVLKCLKHQEAYIGHKGSAFSFFWKQIHLSIAYIARKEARKDKVIYMDDSKIFDLMEYQRREGPGFNEIIDIEEAIELREAFRVYNRKRANKLKKNKDNTIKVLKWHLEKDPLYLERFTTLKEILKSWTV